MPTLDSIYNQTQSEIDRFIAKFDKDVQQVFERVRRIAIAQLSQINAENVLQYEFVWRESLRQAGYYTLVNDLIDTQFDKIYSGVLDAFETGGLATAFTTDDATNIQLLKDLRRDFFVRLGDDVGLAVKRELYRYVIADASLESITAGIEQQLVSSDLARYSQTYARTAIKEFQQEVIDLRASDIEDGVWVYVGVNDGRTRRFCRNVLKQNKCLSDKEKSRLENDPDREYNCRHRFYKMSKEEAMKAGYKCNAK